MQRNRILATTMIFIFLCTSLLCAEAVEMTEHTSTVKPEVVTRVVLSSVDTNRIVSTGSPIKDVIYSDEKGIRVQGGGNNIFIKYVIEENPSTGERKYIDIPTEFFIVCADNTVYTIIAVPQKVPAQTVYLESKKDKIKENIAAFEGIPYEKKVVALIKSVYQDNIPYRYDVLKSKKGDATYPIKNRMVRIKATREVTVSGEGLSLFEYHVTLDDKDAGQLEMSERDFLISSLTEKPVAITLDRHVLSHGQIARLFIVERSTDGGM